jgi:xanthine dehydrogenase YagR molybdenum-binding subunit
VQAACRKAREEALGRAGGSSDLADAMRRIGTPVEASADVAPGEAAKQFSMHAFGAVFAEVAVDADLAQARVRRIVGAYGAGRIINPKLARSQSTPTACAVWDSINAQLWLTIGTSREKCHAP